MIQIKLVGMPWSFTKPKFICQYATVHELSPQNKLWILTFNWPPCSYFFVFDKNGLIKSCSSSEDLSVFKISCYHVDWCKFCIHLRSLKVRHFGMVEGTGLKVRRRDHLQWHDLPTKFHKNLPIGSNVIMGETQTDGQIDRQTDRQTDWWSHKPHFPFWGK
jgi:hypothetical protein